jgi:hypothetical protein
VLRVSVAIDLGLPFMLGLPSSTCLRYRHERASILFFKEATRLRPVVHTRGPRSASFETRPCTTNTLTCQRALNPLSSAMKPPKAVGRRSSIRRAGSYWIQVIRYRYVGAATVSSVARQCCSRPPRHQPTKASQRRPELVYMINLALLSATLPREGAPGCHTARLKLRVTSVQCRPFESVVLT